MSQCDDIIQETDEIDDDGNFTFDSIFDFNKFESFQRDDVQNGLSYTEVDEVVTLEDVMSL
jgi:predicted transcriptional regulator